jgi:poly-gamma-glutamate capsule biosynthesis protein CapA/YwtB (metallophosphatase superfamily)
VRVIARRALQLRLLLVAAAMAAAANPTATQPSTNRERPVVSFALAGDSIITRKLSVYREPEFIGLMDLVRGADVAFTNLEMLFHDYETYPMHESGGTWMRADPPLVKELVWAGFDLVSRANNHAGDYGPGAMRLTTKYVRDAGLVQAGVGESLSEAREARFLETPKGRIALVSAASTFPDHSRASDTRGDVPARPGLSPLRFTTTYGVTRAELDALKSMARELGLNPGGAGDALTLWGHRFVARDRPEVRTEPLKTDMDAIARVVTSAAKMADYVIVSVHSHEGAADRTVPAQFLVAFAHRMIDAGADMFVGHGPHVVRGVEVYNNKPIFYSVGDFIFENETLLRFPAEAYEAIGLGRDAEIGEFNETRSDHDRRGFNADREVWESFVATLEWKGKRLTDLRLHPITLGFSEPMTDRGRPKLADPVLGRHILENVVARSQAFNTRFSIEDGVARVILPAASSQLNEAKPR